jgi:hypothetical protein|tara:strand:- start:470 stop:679 length:210 start_codon:yes stop_codon:yes gene_type:complete
MNKLLAQIKEAMDIKEVRSAIMLAEMSGIDVRKVRRLLNGDGSLKMIDVATILLSLNMSLSAVYNARQL